MFRKKYAACETCTNTTLPGEEAYVAIWPMGKGIASTGVMESSSVKYQTKSVPPRQSVISPRGVVWRVLSTWYTPPRHGSYLLAAIEQLSVMTPGSAGVLNVSDTDKPFLNLFLRLNHITIIS